jgi:excisionase family DNA binding protein
VGTLGGSNRLLSVVETAERLSVSVRTLREHRRAWGLPVVRVGRALRFRERDLEAWIEQQAEG